MATPVLSVEEGRGGFTGMFEIVVAEGRGGGRVKKEAPSRRDIVIAAPRWLFATLAARSTLATPTCPRGRRGQGTMLNHRVGQLTIPKPHTACCPLSSRSAPLRATSSSPPPTASMAIGEQRLRGPRPRMTLIAICPVSIARDPGDHRYALPQWPADSSATMATIQELPHVPPIRRLIRRGLIVERSNTANVAYS
jgi:hypothetical protein